MDVVDNAAAMDVIGRHRKNRIHFIPAKVGRYPFRYRIYGLTLQIIDVDVKNIANSKAVNTALSGTFGLKPDTFKWSREMGHQSRTFTPNIVLEMTVPYSPLQSPDVDRVSRPLVLGDLRLNSCIVTIVPSFRRDRRSNIRSNNVPQPDQLDEILMTLDDAKETDDVDMRSNQRNAALSAPNGMGSASQ